MEYYSLMGESCVTEDALAFISPVMSKLIAKGFDTMYRHVPSLFTFSYGFAERHDSMFDEKRLTYRLLTAGTDAIYKYIKDEKIDAVICTHVFSALMLTAVIEKYGLKMPTAFVSTDYTCSPSNKQSRLDFYFIPHMSIAGEYECPNIPMEKMYASGIPIRQMFYKNKDKKSAKEECGVDPDHRHIIMMCGSMGCGPIEELAEGLAESMEDSWELTIVCGTNSTLHGKLMKKYASAANIHPMGFVGDIATLMDSADIYVTKPGGISVTEAAVKKLPMVFINAVAGCEEYNMNFYLSRGCAKTGKTVRDIVSICRRLLEDDDELEEMRANLEKLDGNNAAQMIHNCMKEKAEKIENENSKTRS